MKKNDLKNTRQFQNISGASYTIMPLSYCVRFDLSVLDVVIFCIIRDFTERGELKKYTGSVKGLQSYCNVAKNTIVKSLAKLEERGFIKKGTLRRGCKNWVTYETDNLNRKNMTIEDNLEINVEMKKGNFKVLKI